MLFRPLCKLCGRTCATIEAIPPHELPTEWGSWDQVRQNLFDEHRAAGSYYLLYEGPGGSNGVGQAIEEKQAARIIAAFAAAPTVELIRTAEFYDDAGFCIGCGDFYCPEHWSISTSGYGVCPRGHGRSLDPHWHPELGD